MSHYFTYLSDFDYISLNQDSKISDYTRVKNFFRRGKIQSQIFNELTFFSKYSIEGDERPDQVAEFVYGDSTLDWVIFLSNNIINVETEWPLASNIFDKVMLEKYGSYENLYSGIHHYETEEIKDTIGNIVLKSGIRISQNWKTNGNFIEVINSKISSISANNTTVTVTIQNQNVGIEEGNQVTLSNVSEREYNGQFIITDVLSSTSFQFELTSPPSNPNPVLADPRVEEVHFIVSETSELIGNSYYYEFFDSGLGYTVHVPKTTFVKEVTNYNYEITQEEKKRDIYLLKPEYLGILIEDIENIMKYKKSSQYESPRVKRGDNSRLFN
jgi:hypothetical protein